MASAFEDIQGKIRDGIICAPIGRSAAHRSAPTMQCQFELSGVAGILSRRDYSQMVDYGVYLWASPSLSRGIFESTNFGWEDAGRGGVAEVEAVDGEC